MQAITGGRSLQALSGLYLRNAATINSGVALTSAVVASPGDDAIANAPLVLGLGASGRLAGFADDIGGRHLMDSLAPVQDFLAATTDSAQKFAFRLDGLRGGSTPSEIISSTVAQGQRAAATGRIDDGNRTAFELYTLQESGRFNDTTFYLRGQVVSPY